MESCIIQSNRFPPWITVQHRLRCPSAIDNLAPVLLTLLQHHLRLVLRDVNRIDIPTRLNTESRPRSSRRESIHSRHINILSRVKLESRLRGRNLEMDLRVRVVERGDLLERLVAGVDGDAGRVRVDDEAVVDIGFLLVEREGLVGGYAGVGFDGACGDAAVVDDLVFVGDESDLCSGDCWGAAEVEVAFDIVSDDFPRSDGWICSVYTCDW